MSVCPALSGAASVGERSQAGGVGVGLVATCDPAPGLMGQMRGNLGYTVAAHASHSRLSPPCDEGFTQEKHRWTPSFKATPHLGAVRLRQAEQKTGLPV